MNAVNDPNFIIVDDSSTFAEIEELLLIFNDHLFPWVLKKAERLKFEEDYKSAERMLTYSCAVNLEKFVDELGDDLHTLFACFERIQHWDTFKAQFQISAYADEQRFFAFYGASKIHSVNYMMYFLIEFFENIDAFIQIYRYDISKDEFGNLNTKKWEKKLSSFFNEKWKNQKDFEPWQDILASIFLSQTKAKPTEQNAPLRIVTSQVNKLFQQLCKFSLRNKDERTTTFYSTHEKGLDLEQKCYKILEQNNWSVRATPKSNDQGADLIAERGMLRLIVQCKNYQKSVGNDAVQQVYAAKTFFGGNIAAVVSQSGYTESAKSLAKKTEVLLMNLDDLQSI